MNANVINHTIVMAHGTITINRAFFYFAHRLIHGLHLLLSAGTPMPFYNIYILMYSFARRAEFHNSYGFVSDIQYTG